MKCYDSYYMQLVMKQQLKEQTNFAFVVRNQFYETIIIDLRKAVPGYFFEFQLRDTIKLFMKNKLWAFKRLKCLSHMCELSILAGKIYAAERQQCKHFERLIVQMAYAHIFTCL